MTRLPLTTRCLLCGEEGSIFIDCDCQQRKYDEVAMKITAQYHALLAKMVANRPEETEEKEPEKCKFNFFKWMKGLL